MAYAGLVAADRANAEAGVDPETAARLEARIRADEQAKRDAENGGAE